MAHIRSGDVIAAVVSAITTDLPKVFTIIDHIAGGWEAWLQVEAALGLYNRYGALVEREKQMPAPLGAYRCDIWQNPEQGTDIVLELKVQNAPMDNILVRFTNDVGKIKMYNHNLPGSIYIALAFMRTFNLDQLWGMKADGFYPSSLTILQFVANQWQNIQGKHNLQNNVPTIVYCKL